MTTFRSQPCVFCSTETITSQSFLSYKGFEAIYNIAPALPGHTLIIPRKHVCSILELNPEELQSMMLLAQRTTQVLGKAFHTKAFNWSIQEQPDAGQTIAHLHLHVLTRNHGDLPKPGDWYPLVYSQSKTAHLDSDKRPRLNDEEIKTIVKTLRQLAQQEQY